MIPWPSAVDADLAGLARSVADRVLAPAADEIVASDQVPHGIVATLVDTGLWGMGLPATVGGGDADLLACAVIVAELATAVPAVALLVAAGSLLGEDADAAVGAALAAGGALAVAESCSPFVTVQGGHPARLDAVRLEVGRESVAALLMTDTGALLIGPPDWSTRGCGEPVERTGLRGLAGCGVEWGGRTVRVPDAAASVRARRAVLHAAVATGLMSAATDEAGEYVTVRHQFGRPLDRFGNVRDRVAALRDAVAGAARTVCSLAAEPAVRSSAAGSAAGSLTSAAVGIAADAIQLHGGYGFITDYPCARRFRDAVSLRALTSTVAEAAGNGAEPCPSRG